MVKKAFVTGGTGFVGAYLCRLLLRKGYRVIACRRGNSRMDLLAEAADHIQWRVGDIMDKDFLAEAMQGVGVVFHCAASVSFDPDDTDRMMRVNVQGTANVVDACLGVGVSQLVHASSVAAIGRRKGVTHIHEALGWEESGMNTPYARSKYLAEQEVWRGSASGLRVGVANPSIILGAGYWDSSSCQLFSTVHNGLRFYPIGATGVVDVRDVAAALVLLAETPGAKGRRYIINGHNVTYRRLFNLMADAMGLARPGIKVTPVLGGVYWRWEKLKSALTGKMPLATRHSTMVASLSYRYDASKSIRELGLVYRDLESTIRGAVSELDAFQKTGRHSPMGW